MFHIIGVAHEVQAKKRNEEDSGDQKRFVKSLAEAIQKVKPALVADEFSAERLNELSEKAGAEHESITARVAASFGVPHRFCDPDRATRAQMGYKDHVAILLDGENKHTSLPNAEVSDCVNAIQIAKYWPLRESFWLSQLKEIRGREVIFICGDAHIDTFGVLLRKNGIDFEIIDRRIGVSPHDNECWARAKRYLASHPELSKS